MLRNFTLKEQGKKGLGLFANEQIDRGNFVLRFRGDLVRYKDLPVNSEKYLQINRDLYLSESGDLDDMVNHSCDPNTIIRIYGNEAILVAIKDIRQDDEITFDYSTSCTESNWEMKCYCESRNCRYKITDFQDLPSVIKRHYIALHAIPRFVLENNELG